MLQVVAPLIKDDLDRPREDQDAKRDENAQVIHLSICPSETFLCPLEPQIDSHETQAIRQAVVPELQAEDLGEQGVEPVDEAWGGHVSIPWLHLGGEGEVFFGFISRMAVNGSMPSPQQFPIISLAGGEGLGVP